MWRRVALVRTKVLEDHTIFTIRVGRICELGTTINWWYVPQKCWFLQEPHGVTSQKTALFRGTSIKNPKSYNLLLLLLFIPLQTRMYKTQLWLTALKLFHFDIPFTNILSSPHLQWASWNVKVKSKEFLQVCIFGCSLLGSNGPQHWVPRNFK
jgi:hypothetical protein